MIRPSQNRVPICGIETEGALPPLRMEIRGIDDPDLLAQLKIELQALMLTRAGTLPGSRDFGLQANFLDYVTPESVNQLAVELSEAVNRWIPEVSLQSVEMQTVSELGAEFALVLTMELREEAIGRD